MRYDEVFLTHDEGLDERFLEVITLNATVGGTYAIPDQKMIFTVSHTPVPTIYGMDKHLDIDQLLSKDYINMLINKVSEMTMIEKEDSIYFLKKQKYELEKTVYYIINKKEEDTYNEKLKELKEKYGDLSFKNEDENDNNTYEKKTVATFYSHYCYTKGLLELLDNQVNYNNFRIKVIPFNYEHQYKFRIDMHVYIDKLYLNSLYDKYKIPLMLFNIMIDKIKQKKEYSEISINEMTNRSNLLKTYKREPYLYQRDNINWMINLEKETKDLNYTSYVLEKHHGLCQIEGLNEPFILNKEKKEMVNPSSLKICKIRPLGGVLADEIGLGKTYSMIGLVAEKLNNTSNPTLILTPPRLCKQWEQEINETYPMKTGIIGTIRQFEKIRKNNIKNYDVIILSYSFLNNKRYLEYCLDENKNEEDELNLSKIYWERIILDEGHEYLTYKMLRKANNREINEQILKLNSKYRWICSGTPYYDKKSCLNIINYICEYDNMSEEDFKEKMYHEHDNIVKKLFRKNTKEKIKNQIDIPEPNIETKFLIQSEIENAIYNSVLGDHKKMIQMCSHVSISDENISILGNNPLSLEEIHKKMTIYYEKKLKRQKKRLETLETKMDVDIDVEDNQETDDEVIELSLRKDELISAIKENQAKYNIFNNLEKKLKEDNNCPICFDELDKKVKAIIPCGHIYCVSCIGHVLEKYKNKCPMCRYTFTKQDLEIVKVSELEKEKKNNINKWGTKMSFLIQYLGKVLENKKNRVIIFSQWDSMLKLIGKVLEEFNIKFLNINGSIHVVNGRIRRFKLDESIRIVLMSSEKAASGVNLQEANHIILIDTMNTDKDNARIIEQQAIGRAVRIGQKTKVNVIRLIMESTIEHDFYVKNTQN